MSRALPGSDLLTAGDRLAILNCRRLPARLDGPQAAAILNFREHDVPVLSAAGLLRPLGKPAANAPKYYAASDVVACAENRDWLDKATRAIGTHWKRRNQRDPHAAMAADRVRGRTAGPPAD
jgi:hypothetical protein